jgi:hypothetical protein
MAAALDNSLEAMLALKLASADDDCDLRRAILASERLAALLTQSVAHDFRHATRAKAH